MAEYGFPKTRRLLQSAQFDRVFAQPSKINASKLTVLARGNDLPHPRLGLIISKRSIRAAVERNRIKRLIREAFRHLQDRLGGVDVIVMSRAGLAEYDNAALSERFSKSLMNAAGQAMRKHSHAQNEKIIF